MAGEAYTASPVTSSRKEFIINEAHKQALADGRRRAAAERRKNHRREAAQRIEAFNAWLKADSAFYANGRQGERPVMPVVPSDADYAHFNGEETVDA